MFKGFLLVFLGGGFGSALRFGLGIWLNQDHLKWIPTLTVNVLGCILLGCLLAYNDKNQLTESLFLLMAVGFCGGLTTFSTFSAELFFLLKQAAYYQAIAYLLVSIILGISAVLISYQIVIRQFN